MQPNRRLLKSSPQRNAPKYSTNYIGSKQKLVDWMWRNTPDGVSSVLDAFSGSAVVAPCTNPKVCEFLPMTVFATVTAARAIIENSSTRLSERDRKAAGGQSQSQDLVQDNFKGIFFPKGVHALIDSLRANCDDLSGYKKGHLRCLLLENLKRQGGFHVFLRKRQDTPDEFKNA